MKENDNNNIEENLDIKINFYEEKIDLKIYSDYNSFIQRILNILKVSQDQLDSFTFSYNDEDGDNIIISNKEDYEIFYQQVKDKTVNSLAIEIKENQKIDLIACFGNALNYQEQIEEEANNQIKDENNNKIDNNTINNMIESKDNIYNNEYNNIINPIDNMIDNNININDYNNDNPNLIYEEINKESGNDVPINDIIFYYRCSSCSIYPIVCVLHYCRECNMYFCEACHQNIGKHFHPILKFESINELMKIKEDENNRIAMENIQNNNKKDINVPKEKKKTNHFQEIISELIPKPFKKIKKKNHQLFQASGHNFNLLHPVSFSKCQLPLQSEPAPARPSSRRSR